jgi:hypothetical protein
MNKANLQSSIITFRPHHFLCTIGYQGMGYDDKFTKNYNEIASRLNSENGDSTKIHLTLQTDDICFACPHKKNHSCVTQSKIDIIDERHAKALTPVVMQNTNLTWGYAKQHIANTISDEIFDYICEPCEWKSFGICKKALQTLRKKYVK